jgi:hypothetical protein
VAWVSTPGSPHYATDALPHAAMRAAATAPTAAQIVAASMPGVVSGHTTAAGPFAKAAGSLADLASVHLTAKRVERAAEE